MHTGSLMNRRAALLKHEETFEQSDRNGYETKPNHETTDIIKYKNTPAWQLAFKGLKSVLNTRKNIPNKKSVKKLDNQRPETLNEQNT